MKKEREEKSMILISLIMTVVICISIWIIATFDYGIASDNDCSVCEWNWVSSELHNYNDPGHGHPGPLEDIWYQANYGKQVDLDWYESYRLRYGLTSVKSFYLINYSNSCPKEPGIKYLGTGYIIEFTDWSYDGPAYSITTIHYNDSNHTFNNCGWNPYPYNKSNLTHVFRPKHGAWWNQFKEAALYDANIYLDKPESINQSWIEYEDNYQWYLDHGGIDIGSEY